MKTDKRGDISVRSHTIIRNERFGGSHARTRKRKKFKIAAKFKQNEDYGHGLQTVNN